MKTAIKLHFFFVIALVLVLGCRTQKPPIAEEPKMTEENETSTPKASEKIEESSVELIDDSDDEIRVIEEDDTPSIPVPPVQKVDKKKVHNHKACTLKAISYAKEQRGLRCNEGHYTVVPTGENNNYVCCTCGQFGNFNGFRRIRRR